MRSLIGLIALILICIPNSAAVHAGDGLTITINNDSSDNILVTILDQGGQPPPRKVLTSTPLYGSASLTVTISAGAHGRGHLSWTAVSMDPDMRMCGRGDSPHLNDGDTVAVHADGDCSR